ncbi:MAG: ATP-binding protein [Pseudomonadota bacterium]
MTKVNVEARKVKVSELRWECDKKYLSFFKEDLPTTQAIVGQSRGLEALTTGLGLSYPGFNIYVAGVIGTGRMATVRRTLEQIPSQKEPPPDRCYVYNFVDSSAPVLLTFPKGQGKIFRDDMKELIKMLQAEVSKTLESQAVGKERELIIERYQRQEKKIFEEFAEKLKKEGFALIQIQEGGGLATPTVFPIVGEEAVSIDYLEKLVDEGKISKEEYQKKKRRHKLLIDELKKVITKARGLGKDMHKALERLKERSAAIIVDGLMEDLLDRYKEGKVRKYLLRVKSDILKNLDNFVEKKASKQEGLLMLAGPQPRKESPLWIYEVNLLIDQSETGSDDKSIIVEEQNPSYLNIFGALEYNFGQGGSWSTDFRYIKAGSLLKADGGYLIVNAMDILRRPLVWDQLKKVLKSEKLVIQQPESYFQFAPLTLNPEPIDLSVKVIMIGPKWLYHLLWNYDEDFPKIFKILSDFDSAMKMDKNSVKQYAAVLGAVAERGGFKKLDKSALAAMLEYGVEDAGHRNRISTRFSYIIDALREANNIANSKRAQKITKEHVELALANRHKRHSLLQDNLQRSIDEGVMLITVSGKRVGQLNGLAVYSLGHTSFGKPNRITAITSLGKSGVINIEREAKLSGSTYDKGILILTGYFLHKFAQFAPLNLSASLCFEQSYGGVDGDSASAAELFSILSSLSNVPIDQGFAVTGSINQFGEIQPIGGVNDKIEGFFDVCKAKGLTGKQGVVIPIQNKQHLMLKKEVVEAVKKKKFHIYAMSTVEEGIEILTGLPAGKALKGGNFTPGSIFHKVRERLDEMNNTLIAFAKKAETKPDAKKSPSKKSKQKKKK